MYGAQRALEMVGIFCGLFLSLILLGFWGVWVIVLAVAQAYVPPEKLYGWLGSPYTNDVRERM